MFPRITTTVMDCACCREFYDEGCYGCPIKEYTGEDRCQNTPYEEVMNTKSKDAVIKEYEFLVNLLNQEVKDE